MKREALTCLVSHHAPSKGLVCEKGCCDGPGLPPCKFRSIYSEKGSYDGPAYAPVSEDFKQPTMTALGSHHANAVVSILKREAMTALGSHYANAVVYITPGLRKGNLWQPWAPTTQSLSYSGSVKGEVPTALGSHHAACEGRSLSYSGSVKEEAYDSTGLPP